MDQYENTSSITEGTTNPKACLDTTSTLDQSTISVCDVSTCTMDQSSDLSVFLAERAARVEARSRAERSAHSAAGLNTTSISMLEQSTISVPSSMETTTWSPFSAPMHHSQELQTYLTTSDLVYYPGFSSPINYSNELSDSMAGGGFGNGSIAAGLHSLLQFGSRADWGRYRADAMRAPSHPEFEPILPSSSIFSRIATSNPRPRGERRFVEQDQPPLVQQAARVQAESLAEIHALHSATATLPPFAAKGLLGAYEPARRTRTISLVSHNSSSDSTNASRGSSGSRDAKDCSYCLSVNKYAIGHNKHNCPVLADLPPCRICGATGKYNHTESHCPNQEKTDLEFIPKERRRTYSF